MEIFRNEQTGQYTARDFFRVIFKHYRKIISLFLAIFVVVAISTFLAPEIYETEAKLFVRLGSETLNHDSVTGERILISQTMETQLNSLIQMLLSRELAANLYDAMGGEAFDEAENPYRQESDSVGEKIRSGLNAALSYPRSAAARLLSSSESMDEKFMEREKKEAAVKELSGNLEAELVPESNIVILRYTDIYPERAQAVLANIIDLYMARHIELNNNPGSYDFFADQSDSLRQQLETAESRFKEAKNEIGVGSLEEHRTILSEQAGYLQQRLDETESGIASSLARIGSLESRMATVPENLIVSETTGSALSAGEEMKRSLYDLRLQEQELLSTFTADSIPVSEIRRQIREAETLVEQSAKSRQVTTGSNPMYQELEIELMLENGTLEALRAQEATLRQQLQNASANLHRINSAEVRLAKLEREKNLLEENYRKYADSLEQVRIEKAREIEKLSNISIAEPPVIPIEPVRPKKSLNFALGFFLAVFGGIGLAFFLEYLDDTFRKPEEAEDVLELPVLGSIEKLPDHSGKTGDSAGGKDDTSADEARP